MKDHPLAARKRHRATKDALAGRLREIGASAERHRLNFPSDRFVRVPLALLDECLAHIKGPGRSGRHRKDTGALADEIVAKLLYSPQPLDKEKLLAEAQKQTGWDKNKMRSLRSSVNQRLKNPPSDVFD